MIQTLGSFESGGIGAASWILFFTAHNGFDVAVRDARSDAESVSAAIGESGIMYKKRDDQTLPHCGNGTSFRIGDGVVANAEDFARVWCSTAA